MASTDTSSHPEWYKGQLHTHSYWSDGGGFPEQTVLAYLNSGYHFFSLTDHNIFPDNTDRWVEIHAEEGKWPANATYRQLAHYVEEMGEDWVETRHNGKRLEVRLKTFEELKSRFERPGEFLMIPGVELTQTVQGRALHVNVLNLTGLPPAVRGGVPIVYRLPPEVTLEEQLRINVKEAGEQSREQGVPHLLMVDHPMTFYSDILPELLIGNPEVRFFEICNNGARWPAPPEGTESYGYEKFWDAVNAHRCRAGDPLLFGVGSDDAHYFGTDPVDNSPRWQPDGFIMVRATGPLDTARLIETMNRGDFYASCGVLLKDISFDEATGTLEVEVQPNAETHYRIEFVVTPKDFSDAVEQVHIPENKPFPERTLPIYSDEIGRIAHTVEGTRGSYRLSPDDLYVRARVVSDKLSFRRVKTYHAEYETAWTQPHRLSR